MHCLNPKRSDIATPNLDKLAAEGTTFSGAHSGSLVCTPTRYGALTGRYAWRTWLQSGVLSSDEKPLIAADRLTEQGLLEQSGYYTAITGKWYLGYTIEGAQKNSAKEAKRCQKTPAKIFCLFLGHSLFFRL